MNQPTGVERATELRWSLWFWISITNAVGMPTLLVFLAAIMGITVDYFLVDFDRDPMYFIYNFILLVSVSVSFVVGHYYKVIRWMEPGFAYLRGQDAAAGADRESATAALTASETMPYHVFVWSVIFYGFGSVAAVAALNVAYAFSFRQDAALFFGIIAMGMMISVFQFYTSRRVLVRFQAGLLGAFPDLLLEEMGDRTHSLGEVGLKTKFQGAVLTLAVVSVILTSVAAFNGASRAFQMQLGDLYKLRVDDKASHVDNLLERGASPEDRASYLNQIKLDNIDEAGRAIILLLDKEGANLLAAPPPPGLEQVARIIQEGVGHSLAWGRPCIHTVDDDVYATVVRNGSALGAEFAVVHQPYQLADLFVFIPNARWSKAMNGLYWMVYGFMFIVLLPLALVFGKLSSEEIRDSLVSLMKSLRAMAKGDLTQNVTVTGRDEIGEFSRALARAIFGLKRLIGEVTQAAHALEEETVAMRVKAGSVHQGSESQVQAVQETSSAAAEMRGNVRGIADSIQTLATSAEESSSSIIEVQATIEEVSANVESLSSSVMQTTSSIQEMNSSIKEVDANMQHLTRQAAEAVGALSEMERMIKQVSEGSRQTRVLSEQVDRDAQQGAKSVELTIAGIDKIRATSQRVAEVIDRLGKRAHEIGNVLTVIEDVTEETNLLALNAAIIAAQAGEHGRGFAVVADEIKDLAERTAASTHEIAELIGSVQEDAQKAVQGMHGGTATINEGVELSDRAGSALKQIQESVRLALTQSKAIAEAVTVQTEKSRQVMQFMDGLNSLALQVATATQQQARSGDQIAEASYRMEQISTQVKRATQEQLQGSRQITQAIEHIAEITHYINTSQSDQLRSTEQVSSAVDRIRDAAENNQREARLMSESMEKLRNLSQSLHQLISEFTI